MSPRLLSFVSIQLTPYPFLNLFDYNLYPTVSLSVKVNCDWQRGAQQSLYTLLTQYKLPLITAEGTFWSHFQVQHCAPGWAEKTLLSVGWWAGEDNDYCLALLLFPCSSFFFVLWWLLLFLAVVWVDFIVLWRFICDDAHFCFDLIRGTD